MGTIYKYKPSGVATTGSGEWSGNTAKIIGDLCYQIYAKAATSTTTFDVVITNSDDFQVRKFTNLTGVMNDLTPTPMSGIHTFAIENASRLEAFTIRLCVLER